MSISFFPLLFSSLLQAEPLSLETDRALAVHLSQYGLNQIGEAIIQLIPTSIPITGASSSLECSSDTIIDYTVSDIDIVVSMDQVLFTPENGTQRSGNAKLIEKSMNPYFTYGGDINQCKKLCYDNSVFNMTLMLF